MNKLKTATFLLSAALFSCTRMQNQNQAPKPQIDSKFLISCDGIGEVKITDSYVDLEKKFGAQAISEHENTQVGKFTTLWENDPKQINIFWKEKKAPFKTIKYMEAVAPFSSYMTLDSIQNGMTIRDLVKKNGGMPVSFRNVLASSQPGVIVSFNRGDISKSAPCIGGTLEITQQKNVYLTEQNDFRRKEVIESSDRMLERIKVGLSSIRVNGKQ